MLTSVQIADLKRDFPGDREPQDDNRPSPKGPEEYGLPIDGELLTSERNQTAKGFKFELFREFALNSATKRHIIKGIFVRGETSMVYGPPGSLKSSLMADAFVAIASGADWFGRRNKEKCAALYWALERSDLSKRRLMATAESMDLPIAVVSDVIDIVSGRDNAKVIATIREFEDAVGLPVGIVCFDTFSKLIAAGNGDEDKARDQNKLFANIQRIKNQTDIHVNLIGHTGKDESRGNRGSNASKGDVDVEIALSGEMIRTASVTKANDISDGPLFSFKSKVHTFSIDEDGDPITVNIVSDETVSETEVKRSEPRLKGKNQQTLFAILHAAGAAGLSLDEWNEQAREAGIGVKRPADLTDIHLSLKCKGLVRTYNDRWNVCHD